MQTANLKVDIISWVSGLEDRKVLQELYSWATSKREEVHTTTCIVPPKRQGDLTEGFNIWGDEGDSDNLTDYRKEIWQTKRNTW